MPKTSSIRPLVSTQYRLVMHEWTDRHATTAYTLISARIASHGYNTHTCLTALCPGLPEWAGTRKVKPMWILLKQETVSGSGISWAICKSAPHSRQIYTTPLPHHSVFYRPDALPATQPTASKHWKPSTWQIKVKWRKNCKIYWKKLWAKPTLVRAA